MDAKLIRLGIHSFKICSFEAQSFQPQQFFNSPIQGLSGVGFNKLPQNHIAHIRIAELIAWRADRPPFLDP